MLALFKVVRGPGVGRRFQLRGGQRASVGGTDHADYRFPDDRSFQPVHFMIDCGGGQCRLIARPSAATFVNDRAVDDCRLVSGDLIRVGRTTFVVSIEGDIVEETDQAVDTNPTPVPVAAAMTMEQLWDYLELEPENRSIAQTHREVESLIDELVQSKLYVPALRLRTHTLGNRHAVWWACVSLRHSASRLDFKPLDLAAIVAAENVIRDSSEKARRDALAASEAAGDGATSMVAFAAFASGGNIGHPDVDPVEPDERMCGKILAGALVLAGYSEPSDSHFIISEMIANGKAPWKQPFQLPA